MTRCVAPYCTEDAKFAEPAENGEYKVCKKHCDPTKNGINRL